MKGYLQVVTISGSAKMNAARIFNILSALLCFSERLPVGCNYLWFREIECSKNMASSFAEVPGKSLTADIAEELRCVICLEKFTSPKVLNCLHTFCLECLNKWVNSGTINCPTCRRQTKVSNHSRRRLGLLPRPNHYLSTPFN